VISFYLEGSQFLEIRLGVSLVPPPPSFSGFPPVRSLIAFAPEPWAVLARTVTTALASITETSQLGATVATFPEWRGTPFL